jgi:hypothetical protein
MLFILIYLFNEKNLRRGISAPIQGVGGGGFKEHFQNLIFQANTLTFFWDIQLFLQCSSNTK